MFRQCDGCRKKLRSRQFEIPLAAGVKEAVVSHESGTAVVTMEIDTDTEVMKKAVEDEGYQVIGIN